MSGALKNETGTREASRIVELEREIDRRIDEYARLVREIETAIDAVADPQCREVLRYRYLNGWSWQRIAGEMNYSQDWLWRLHARALEAVKIPAG